MEPEEATQLRDVQTIFGEDNYRRRAGEPITKDSWTNYDRIASRSHKGPNNGVVARSTQWSTPPAKTPCPTGSVDQATPPLPLLRFP
jgi:hypothetical protein